MAKYLVIGSKGTLGNEFRKMLGDQGVYLDKNQLDITSQELVMQKIAELEPEIVINCAAYNAVDKAEQEPDVANLINGEAVGYIAKAAENIGATLIHYSTNYVFKGDSEAGYTEDSPTDPQSEYGKSKLMGENAALENCSKAYVIRTAWLYGEQGDGESSKVNYITRILQLSEEKDFLEGVDDQYGQPTWTKDLAKFSISLVDGNLPFGIYHGTNSGEATWYTWAKEILEIRQINVELRKNVMANFQTSGHNASRPQYGILLNTKAPPMRPWQEALKDYLNQ